MDEIHWRAEENAVQDEQEGGDELDLFSLENRTVTARLDDIVTFQAVGPGEETLPHKSGLDPFLTLLTKGIQEAEVKKPLNAAFSSTIQVFQETRIHENNE